MSELDIQNPAHYPFVQFVRIDKLEVKALPSSFLGGCMTIRNLEIEVSHLTGVRSAEGAVNLEEFRESLEKPSNEGDDGPGRQRQRKFCIDRLLVKIGSLVTYDCIGGTLPRKKEYPVGLAREFLDVRDLLPVGVGLIEDLKKEGVCIRTDSIFGKVLSEKNWSLILSYWKNSGTPNC